MSSRTPEECIELALDDSADRERREDAIRALKRANECDELAALVRKENLEEQYRRLALESLATPQCDSTLRGLVEAGDLEQPLSGEAEDHLQELEDGE